MASNFDLVNVVFDGELEELLRRWKLDLGVSNRKIAKRFKARGVNVSHETIRRWCLQRGIEKSDAEEEGQ